MSLAAFIWKDRTNRIYLYCALATGMGLWLIFKLVYIYPNLIFDSYMYIRAAVLDQRVNAWPIGYSRFLQFFSLFSHSANLLVTLQYWVLELSCLLFFFTWRYLFQPGKWISNLLFVLLFANPILLFCANYILSDALFISLSILWFTQLWWIIVRPRPWMILVHALLLFLVFTVRYNALYYPFVAALAFLLSRQRPWLKVAGIALPLVLVLGFIHFTSSGIASITGQRQFSPFGGWKLANDALYMYAKVQPADAATVPSAFRPLDSTVRQYFATAQGLEDTLESEPSSGSYFMFDPRTPLVLYMERLHPEPWPFFGTRTWYEVAPLYQSYGLYLIKKYPLSFARYFLLPNCLRYAVPPAEFFGSTIPFQLHESHGGPFIREMFGLTTIMVPASRIELSRRILYTYPTIFAIIHFCFILGCCGFTMAGGWRRLPRHLTSCIILAVGLWLCDLGFSVVSAGIVLRYQIFMMIIESSLGCYFIAFTYRNMDKVPPDPNSNYV